MRRGDLRCNTAIYAGEICLEEFELLFFGAEGADVEVVAAVGVGGILEVGFGVDHDYSM